MQKILKGSYNAVVVEIGGFTTVWEDNYEDGQVRYGVNEWELETQTLEFNSLNKTNLKKVKKAILEALNWELYKNIKTLKNCTVIDNRVEYSQFVNARNEEPTKLDYKMYKKGDINLYVQDINITLKINGVEVLNEDLDTILAL